MSRNSSMMSLPRLAGISAFGLVALLAAILVRNHVQSLRKTPAPISIANQAQPLIEELHRLRLAVDQNPKDVPRRWALASYYERNQLIPQAIIQLDAILNLDPNNEKASLELAQLLLASRQFKTAEQAYLDITHRYPRSAEGWQGLSAVYFKETDYVNAMHAAQVAYRLKPDDPDNKLALAVSDLNYALQFAQTDAYGEQYEQARALLTELAKTWPNSSEVQSRLGHTLRVMRRYQEAIPILRHAHEMDPANSEAVIELARAYSFSGDRANARKVAEAALDSTARSSSLYALYAQLVQQSGEQNSEAKAVTAYEQAVQMAPHDTSYRERLGSAYLRVNRVEDARKVFEKLVLDDPNRSYPYQQLATIYSRMGQRARSAAAATMATRMAANENQLRQIQLLSSQDPDNINLHLVLADRYMDLKSPGPARDEYEHALKIDPKNEHAKDGLAKLDLLKSARSDSPTLKPNQSEARKD